MKVEINPEDPVLSLYIKYDELPIDQLAGLLDAVDDIVTSVARIYPPRETLEKGFPLFLTGPALCVESINTGNSIGISLRFSKRGFRVRYIPKEETFSVQLPNWSAALVLTALILSQGANYYQKYLEIEKLRKENELLSQQLSGVDLSRLNDQTSPDVNQFHIHMNRFFTVVNQDTIYQMQVNGVPVKDVTRKAQQ